MKRHLLLAAALAAVSPAVVTAAPAATQNPETEPQRPPTLEERVQRLESASAPAPAHRVDSNAFNPAISLILDGKYTRLSRDPGTYTLPGFALGQETGPGERGLGIGESELIASANADNLFYGQLTAALTPENTVEIEEAFFETLDLGAGATLKGGRFFSHIGYLNSVHAHAWDFVDQPLVYRALFANQFGDDGVQLRWVAPTDLLLEIGAELFRGEGFPAGGATHDGKGARSAFLHVGGDIGASHAWRLGLSHLKTDAVDRATGDETTPDLFTGASKSRGVDFVWKWAPNGNSKYRNAKFQAEYWTRDENGTFDPASAGTPFDYRGKQKGWYAQAVYQFLPRWRLGLRRDQLESDAVDGALAGTVLDNLGHDPRRTSVMIDFSNSEFSRLRVQFNRDESRLDKKDNQVYLQYVMSLGSHGAHAF